MVKVENGMLVLDASFTKEDVEAIDKFVSIAENRVREQILGLLEDYWQNNNLDGDNEAMGFYKAYTTIARSDK